MRLHFTGYSSPCEAKSMNRIDRRTLLMSLGGLGALSALPGFAAIAAAHRSRSPSPSGSRARRAFEIRLEAARMAHHSTPVVNRSNGDEDRYPSRLASHSKALPHDALGIVDPAAYSTLLAALKSGKWSDLERVPLGGSLRMSTPLAAYTFSLDGPDSHHTRLAAPPRFDSAWQAGEAVELYWRALMRDVPFADFESDPLAARACDDLNRLTDFRGPKIDGRVTPETLFRHDLPGALTGPHVSQFLWKELSFGSMQVFQKVRTYFAEYDYLTTEDEWLAIQNGSPARAQQLGVHRYIRNARDLAAYVQVDFTYQAAINAALILFSMQGNTDASKSYHGAPFDEGNPYRRSRTQSTPASFGLSHALDLIGRVSLAALRAAFYHKWLVHRRLRPEEYCGRVHNHLKKRASYPLHDEILASRALEEIHKAHGTWLLPQAYTEGCPSHPSYPSGHAAIAGAGVTVLKAFFQESWPIDKPVVASSDGLTLAPHRGPELTVGGELNKLAANLGSGRDGAGIHWRTDSDGIRLGEELAIALMREWRLCYAEPFEGWSLTKFDGTIVKV